MAHNFNSQCGEDAWLYHEGILPDNGFYIDLGSADGTINSNTKLLDDMGWGGICVEPNPVYMESYANRKCALLPMAVNGIDGSVYFNFHPIHEIGKITTKDQIGKEKVNVIPGLSLASIVKSAKVDKIDLLSIDLEGNEYNVLKEYFKTDLPKPTIIITEYDTLGVIDNRVLNMLKKKMYKLVHKTDFNYILTL
jgi:FkbM family methyltransferase